jgi:4'-phosphopantetheinyl transferase
MTSCLTEADIKAADRYLSIEERARRDRFYLAADRRDFTVAHDLLRRTLSFYGNASPADWRFTTNEYGKPSIDSGDSDLAAISFSISHTKGCVACGVTVGAPLGVDLELTDRPLSVNEIADRYFSPDEAAWLRRCSDGMRGGRFTELWTLKEAFLKATGVGLSGSLASVSFRFEEPGRIMFTLPPNIECAAWHFALFDLGSCTRLGVAVCGGWQPQFTVRGDGVAAQRLGPLWISSYEERV